MLFDMLALYVETMPYLLHQDTRFLVLSHNMLFLVFLTKSGRITFFDLHDAAHIYTFENWRENKYSFGETMVFENIWKMVRLKHSFVFNNLINNTFLYFFHFLHDRQWLHNQPQIIIIFTSYIKETDVRNF